MESINSDRDSVLDVRYNLLPRPDPVAVENAQAGALRNQRCMMGCIFCLFVMSTVFIVSDSELGADHSPLFTGISHRWDMTPSPTASTTVDPTTAPTASPVIVPTGAPIAAPTSSPTVTPTHVPTATPTTSSPTKPPTIHPTPAPTTTPTPAPTVKHHIDRPPTSNHCEEIEYTNTASQSTFWLEQSYKYRDWGLSKCPGSYHVLNDNITLGEGVFYRVWGT